MAGITWHDFERNQYGVIRGGLSGQYGDMPPELLLVKNEQTCMYEDDDQLNSHYRSTLKDRTCDPTTMASDVKRDEYSQNVARSVNLHIRECGAPTPAEPIHPELMLGFTERDPRGYTDVGPDMRKSIGHTLARISDHDMLTDIGSDRTIASGTKSEMQHIRELRNTIAPSKERLKIFDTSEDGRSTKSALAWGYSSGVTRTTPDGQILDLNNDPTILQRTDNTHLRTDTVRIGYRQLGDHKFNVAQYSIVGKRKERANIHDAQYGAHLDHKYETNPSEVKNKLFKQIVEESHRRKYLDNYAREMRSEIKDNFAIGKNRISRIIKDLTTVQKNTQNSASVIDLAVSSGNIKKVRVFDPLTHEAVYVDPGVFSKILENKNITFSKKVDDTLRFNVANLRSGMAVSGGDDRQTEYTRTNLLRKYHGEGDVTRNVVHEQNWYDPNMAPIYKNPRSTVWTKGVNATYTEMGQGVDPKSDAVFDRYVRQVDHPTAGRAGMIADTFSEMAEIDGPRVVSHMRQTR